MGRKAMVVEVHQLLKISDGLIEDAKLMKQRVKKFLPESRTPTASPASSPPASPAKAPMEDPMEEDLDEGTDSGSDSDSDNHGGRYNHEEAQDETKEHALPELDEDEEDDDDGDEDGSLPKWQPKYQFTHGQRALQVYLPGVAPQDVRFNLTAGRGSGKMLTIRGIKRPTTQQWHTFQHRQQLHQQQWGTPLDTAEFGRFEVNLELGRGVVDAKNISCSMDPMAACSQSTSRGSSINSKNSAPGSHTSAVLWTAGTGTEERLLATAFRRTSSSSAQSSVSEWPATCTGIISTPAGGVPCFPGPTLPAS